jgi:hypothetical protein
MLTVVFVRTTDRIPGFAICARCAARRELGSCSACGLLVCRDCRGGSRCAVCHGDALAAEATARRRGQRREVVKRAVVVAMVAASGVTGLGAAFMPAGPMCANGLAPIAIELHSSDGRGIVPVSLEAASPPWNQPLAFHCFQMRSDLTCCVVETP